MALLKQAYEIQTDNIKRKILVYGQPGIGKSTLALSMPNPVLIDADNGVHRIAPVHRVPTLQVTSYQEVLDLLDSGELSPFDTIVIDTAGKLLDYINVHIIQENPKNGRGGGQLTQQGWGARAQKFNALLRTVTTMGKHLVFVAHEKEERDADTKVVRPDFGGGKAGNELIKDLDLVGYMEALGRERTISFAPSDKYYAKNAARINDVLMIPTLTDGTPNDFLSGIVNQCDEAARDESAQRQEYDKVMMQVLDLIDCIEDADTANKAGAKIQKLPQVWDSLIRARSMYAEKVKALGLKYDKIQKSYVSETTADQQQESPSEEVA